MKLNESGQWLVTGCFILVSLIIGLVLPSIISAPILLLLSILSSLFFNWLKPDIGFLKSVLIVICFSAGLVFGLKLAKITDGLFYIIIFSVPILTLFILHLFSYCLAVFSDSNKWDKIGGGNYLLQDLGRPAIFFIPTKKLDFLIGSKTVRDEIQEFLIENFGGYTHYEMKSFGCWRDGSKIISDQCVVYEVSFIGKDKIPILLEKLAVLSQAIEENCIYVKTGQYAALVSPPKF